MTNPDAGDAPRLPTRRKRKGEQNPKSKTAERPPATAEQLSPAVRRAASSGGVINRDGQPTQREREAARLAEERDRQRPPRPIAVQTEGRGVHGPYDDDRANYVRMLDTFGTNSFFFLHREISDLQNMVTKKADLEDADQVALNAGIAMVAAIAPENELEAMLAVQMAGTHAIACEMTGRSMRCESIERLNVYANLATKFQRTFTAQLEALARLRGKGQQTVRVEHVTVEPGAQAIVGDVHHHHAKGLTHGATTGTGDRAPLPGPDPIRQTLPEPGNAERPMPNARRPKPRRSKGE